MILSTLEPPRPWLYIIRNGKQKQIKEETSQMIKTKLNHD